MVVIIMGGSIALCFSAPQEEEAEFSITGEVIGLSSYNQPKLDVDASEVLSEDVPLGTLFRIETPTETFENAVLIIGYKGMFMFDLFVNVESDGKISVGCVGKLVEAEKGSSITLTKTGVSERYKETPCYNKGQSDSREDYPSDAVFANFYEVTGGTIASGILYRSYSPYYDQATQPRSYYVNKLAEEAGIAFDIALSYSDKTIADAISKYEGYCLDLCKEGKYIAPSMGYLYFQQKEKTVAVLESIIDNDGPYLIHCNAGRDRTGFMVLLIQALCGCSVDEMKENEARAFQYLYGIETDSKEYRWVVECTYERNMYLIANPDKIPDIFEIDWEHIDTSSVDTYSAAYSYCTDYLELTEDQVDTLISKFTAAATV